MRQWGYPTTQGTDNPPTAKTKNEKTVKCTHI